MENKKPTLLSKLKNVFNKEALKEKVHDKIVNKKDKQVVGCEYDPFTVIAMGGKLQ